MAVAVGVCHLDVAYGCLGKASSCLGPTPLLTLQHQSFKVLQLCSLQRQPKDKSVMIVSKQQSICEIQDSEHNEINHDTTDADPDVYSPC